MKTPIISLIAVVVLFSPLTAQYPPSGPEITADMDSLLDAGMDELLSYLLLTREDFTFRDDYLEKDSFRLNIVDSVMAHPLKMNELVDQCRKTLPCFEASPDSVGRFLRRCLAGWQSNIPKCHSDEMDIPRMNKLNRSGKKFYGKIRVIGEFIEVFQNWLECHMGGDWGSEQNLFLMDKYRELILEDPSDAQKSAEEQDSISNIEEGYARHMAALAPSIPNMPSRLPGDNNLEGALILKIDSLRDICINDKTALSMINGKFPAYKSESGFGNVVVGTMGDDTYEGEYFFILDPGGNDTYRLSYDPHNPHPVIIADFAGDDIYTAETDFALACGAFAYSLLIDYEGDDIYRGGNFSLGAGYFGVGILWDKKGNDSYFGDTFTQGAGTFGLGLLIDSDGSDTYTGNLYCQGFGFVNGIGGLIDNSGNDSYVVQPKYGDFIRYEDHYISLSQGFGYGIRPWLSGGWGFLFDYGGNDVYVCDIFGQGASYWYSLGMLYDKSGNDQYLSHQYAQGNGTHMSVGILRDDAGNDIYRAYGVSQGCGHDYGCGWLQDRRGDDLYTTNDLGHGAGQANGIGIFTDLIGNDRYYVLRKNNTEGYGNPRRDYGSLGIFLDLDGDDYYGGNGANNYFWTVPGSKWGGGLDRQNPVPDSADTAGVTK